ncbi:testicular acid phosphatase homolog [Convolutriloba macropyga]|uniref:testicular acid phosphatase homolog n=1 Tax=Convolutriloba macropyga TaxID=536237 RepID=UPI003F5208B5
MNLNCKLKLFSILFTALLVLPGKWLLEVSCWVDFGVGTSSNPANSGTSSAAMQDSLILVVSLVRHGTATPGILLPNDPHMEMWNKIGYPQKLTPVGSQQQYELGKLLRERYGNQYISERFSPNEISIVSTGRSRSMLAAQNTMAGFYNLQRDQTDFEKCSGMEVHPDCEVFPVEKTAELTYRELWYNCSRLLELNRKTIGPLRTIALQGHQEFFEKMTRVTGFQLTNFNELRDVHEAIDAMKAYHLPLPPWATKDIVNQLKALYTHDYDLLFTEEEQRRLTGGPVLNIILNALKESAHAAINSCKHLNNHHDGHQDEECLKDEDLPPKMKLLFGHTSSMMSLTKAIGIELSHVPGFAACLVFELYQSSDNPDNFYIKTLFKNSTQISDFYLLQIPHCGSKWCELNKFVDTLEHMAVTNYTTECGKVTPLEPYTVGNSFLLKRGKQNNKTNNKQDQSTSNDLADEKSSSNDGKKLVEKNSSHDIGKNGGKTKSKKSKKLAKNDL